MPYVAKSDMDNMITRAEAEAMRAELDTVEGEFVRLVRVVEKENLDPPLR